MYNTLAMLQNLLTREDMEMPLDEISAAYQSKALPNLLASAYNKLFGLTLKLATKYRAIENEDIATKSLQILDYCLLEYDGASIPFVNYYAIMLTRELREEMKRLNTDKRRVKFFSSSYDALLEDGYEQGYEQTYDIIEILDGIDLTKDEALYCRMAVNSFRQIEINEALNISKHDFYKMKSVLGHKILEAM